MTFKQIIRLPINDTLDISILGKSTFSIVTLK